MARPIILYKYDESLCGYSVAAIFMPKTKWKEMTPVATICLNEIYFRVLQFRNEATKASKCQIALDFYSKKDFAPQIFDLTESGSDKNSDSSSDVSGDTLSLTSRNSVASLERARARYDYIEDEFLPHQLAPKVNYYNHLWITKPDDSTTHVMCGVKVKLAKRLSQEFVYAGKCYVAYYISLVFTYIINNRGYRSNATAT